MSIASAFRLTTTNANTTPEVAICLVALLAGLIFYAEEFRIGVICHLIIFAALFVWFYTKNMIWGYPLIAIFIFLVLLTFSLMASQGTEGGVAS